MDFFKPTEKEIKEAQGGSRPEFKHNEEVTFLIDECTEKVDDKGEKFLIVGCKLVGGEHDGKKYSHFIRDNKTSKGIWINMLKALFDDATVASGTLTPMSLVNRQLKSTAKLSAKNDKTYVNFWEFAEAGGAPDLNAGTATVNASDIPF